MQTERCNNAAHDKQTTYENPRMKHSSVYPQPNTPPPQAFHSEETAVETPADDVEEGRQHGGGPVPLQSQAPPPRRSNKLLLFWLYLALLVVVACTVAGLVVGFQGKNNKNKDGVESMASVPMDTTSMVQKECTPKVHKNSNAKFSLDSTKIVAPGTYQFGYRVAIHDAMAVVGGEGSSRAAHVFVWGASYTWKLQAVLKGLNNEPLGSSGVAGIYCGTAIVGSMLDKNKQGSAHIFVQTTDSNWVHQKQNSLLQMVP